MAYSKPTNSISNSKKKFFEKFYNHEIASTDDIDGRTGNISYTTLLKNQKALEVEFIQMFAVLQKQKDENDEKNKAFWLYCYFCATLLEAFHKAYSQQSKEEEYKK